LPETLALRLSKALPALILAGGLLFTVVASRFVGPTFDEEARVNAVRRATELWRAVTQNGPMTLFDDSADRVYRELSPFGAGPALFSGWLGEVASRAGIVDRLVGARLGWLLLSGLAPGALFFIVRPSRGPRVAALAAALLLSVPRWIHGAAAAREPVVVSTLWLVLLAFYIESVARGARRRKSETGGAEPLPSRPATSGRIAKRGWLFAAFGVFLGFAVAVDFASLWVLLLIVVHFCGVRGRRAFGDLRRGRVPLPAVFLPALGVAPIFFLLFAPPVWKGGTGAIEWVLSGLSPLVEPVLYRGPVVSAEDVSPLFAAHWLVATTPAWLVLLGIGGAVVSFLDARDARRGLLPPDPVRLGLLVALCLAAVIVVGPLLTPQVLLRFPPRAEAALPFLVVFAAIALDKLTTRVVGDDLAARILSPLAAIALLIAAINLRTAGASFSTLVGGTRGAVESQIWTVGDGSEIAGLARSIDALGIGRLTVEAHEIPRGIWTLLNQSNRLKTRVEPARQAEYRITRGAQPNSVGTVEREKAVLWTLSRR
jgi:hypothetical protein